MKKTEVSDDISTDDSSTDDSSTDDSTGSWAALRSLTNKKIKAAFKSERTLPWYRAGGLHITLNGMALTILGPIAFLANQLPGDQPEYFMKLTLFCIASALLTTRTIYCVIVVPCYMVSLLLCTHLKYSILLLPLSLAISILKVNICMSVCLHRYAAHNAFHCGPITNVVMCAIGCLANQGGPIWWASQHRCHHKFCDVPRDPHSPLIDGTEKAFGFFHHNEPVVEEFVPMHLESTLLRIMDTWSWLLVGAEYIACYHLFGNEGLFVAFTSSWLCQAVTCWFNIVNHPVDHVHDTSKCKAYDGIISVAETGCPYYLPFYVLNNLYPLFALFVMEGEHEHHHDHPSLAKRTSYDPAYWGFLKPLELMGLVWNVKV